MELDTKLLDNLNEYVRIASTAGADKDDYLKNNASLDDKWREIVGLEGKKLFNKDGNLILENLKNFRRKNVFVSDIYPVSDYSSLSILGPIRDIFKKPLNFYKIAKDFIKELIHGECIGNRRLLREIYSMLESEGALDLLKKYPVVNTPGNPYFFKYQGTFFNYRWARHIYFINLVRKNIGKKIAFNDKFVSLDIGCSYGIFSYLFKSEYPNTTQVLLDFPDQLVLSKYFLGSLFPNAKFGDSFTYRKKGRITKEDISQYDFFFLTINDFDLLTENSVDLFTNFYSFGEMRREWFFKYIESKPFQTSDFLFTCNRFESSPRYEPTYDTDLTILDYPLDSFETKFFAVNPIYPYYCVGKLFRYEMRPLSSQYFDFIGERKE